jgi:methylenetetrahydrofolate reductase (NADPH)
VRKSYPEHGLLAEESGASEQHAEFVWVIDPLDGTTNFLHGFPQYCVSIALLHKGAPEQAVIFDPNRNELFTASKGSGAYLNERRIRVSFEFFPPKTEEMEKTLWDSVTRLAPLKPNFVSVTYGAGGSTRERTHSTVKRILAETTLTPAAHLTCVAATKNEINDVIGGYRDAGVRHIVALRGDPIGGLGEKYAPHPGGYENGADLVAGIKRLAPDIDVSVSAYPEKHPDSSTVDADIDMLQAKVDAGAARAITQVFFDNDLYFRYLDRVRARGINIPIVPGIMPMHNFKQARSFVTRAGTTVPSWLADKFEGLDDDAETRKLVAATVAAGQVQKLAKHGVDTFHFYTMNRADLVFAISHLLGIRPNGAQKAA